MAGNYTTTVEANVLLIGSTGSGKSTLGNFLIDPSDETLYSANQFFTTARSVMPQTQNVSSASTCFPVKGTGSRLHLTVIDTPGLNESAVHDLQHMTDIIAELEQRGEIRACILVIKFNSKVDRQYKSTVQYYSKLLPFLFDKNVVIVMTGFATDEKTEKRRMRERVDVEQVKNTMMREIVACANLNYEPTLFAMDCLPDEGDEREAHLAKRHALLLYIMSRQPVKMRSVMVAKTDDIVREDEKSIQRLEGEVNGYNDRLIENEKKAATVLNETAALEKEVTGLDKQLAKLRAELSDKNKSDTVVVQHWSCSDEYRVLRWLEKEFDLQSAWEIHGSAQTWTNSKCEFKGLVQTRRKVSGKVKGQFMRGLYASVTIEALKKVKYAVEIGVLNNEILSAEREKSERNDELAKIADFKKETELLRQKFKEKRSEISALSPKLMTIEQARERLKTLNRT